MPSALPGATPTGRAFDGTSAGAAPTLDATASPTARGSSRDACANCGAAEVRRYCAECGQRAPTSDDYSTRAHAAELFGHVTNVDGREWRTLRALVTRPGLLTVEHLRGRRASYLRPLQLFLVLNVALFFAAPHLPLFSYSLANYLEHAPPSPALVRAFVGTPTPAYAAAFDVTVETLRKSLVILFVPAFALVLRLATSRRTPRPGVPHRYGEHVVFALNALAFAWLLLVGWGIVAEIPRDIVGTAVHAALALLVVLSFGAAPLWLHLALRRAYALGNAGALALLVTLGVSGLGFLVAYRSLMFFATWLAVRVA